MLGSSRSLSHDIAEIERQVGNLKRDLESGLGSLRALTRRGASRASRQARHYVSDVAGHLRVGAGSARSLTDGAARFSGQALRRIGDEVERRPLLALAVVAGIAVVLAGLIARRHGE